MKHFLIPLFAGALFIGCHQASTVRVVQPADSVEILRLLKDVYHWHDDNQTSLSDFSIIIKDSLQVGLNFDSLKRTLAAFIQTNYFSSGFIDNYKNLANRINTKMTSAQPKLLNEINFDFQEADPWTGFQDSAPVYWNKFKITEFKVSVDSASLKWQVHMADWTSEPYQVKFSFEGGKWRVAYLEGFDLHKY